MRHNNKSIQIASLNEKKVRKKNDLEENHIASEAMIKKHKKRIANMKFKTVVVPGDKQNTQFLVREGKDIEEVIRKYKDSRKY